MTGKIDPNKLSALTFEPRPDPLADLLRDPEKVREALGVDKLSPADLVRLEAGCGYSPASAKHFVDMTGQFLRHSKGRWGGQPMIWHEWQQRDWIRPVFGWFKDDGTRCVNRVYLECGKKSGKSTFASAVAVYMCVFFGEHGAEVYSLAGTEEQAKIVQLQVEQCVRNAPELEPRARIQSGRLVKWPQSDSYIQAMSGKGASGFNPFCLILDELHEWVGMQAYERWTYGSRARDNWLHFAITNAGDEQESVCYRQRSYCLKVMAGEVEDPHYYGKVYAIPREHAEAEVEAVSDGATEIPYARITNPGLGTILRESDLIVDIKRAIHIPSEMPNLLRFTYCVWRTATRLEWLERYWDACRSDYTLEDMAAYPCWLGLDLSQVCDLSALTLMCRTDGGEYWQWPYYWVPRRRAKELRKYTAVEVWEKDRAINVVEDEMIDPVAILAQMLELTESHDVRGLIYDPKEAALLVREFDDQTGLDCFPFKQSHEGYHEPTDNYEGHVKAGTMRHPDHPIFNWQAKHTLCKSSTHGHKKPIKPDQEGAPHKTVDGVQAAIMAFSQARLYQEEELAVHVLS